MKVKEVIAKIAGKHDVYPNGTKVCITNVGEIYPNYRDAFNILKFNNKEFNDPYDYCGVWEVKNKIMYRDSDTILYHIVNGNKERLIGENGIDEYIETITIEGKKYNKEEVIKRLSELETVD